MRYDLDTKIEEAAQDLANDEGLELEDLQDLRDFASNKHSARVFARAIELRQATTEGLCPSTTSR